MKNTPIFRLAYDSKKAYVIGIIEYKAEDITIADQTHQVYISAYTFNQELQLLANAAPERPNWFTLSAEEPQLFHYPFINTFAEENCMPFIEDLIDKEGEGDKEALYEFGCELARFENTFSLEQKYKNGSDLEKKLFKKIEAFKPAFDKAQEQYNRRKSTFEIKREAAWKYYHAFMMMKVRYQMFSV